jgi:RNA polymerase sigma-70 factor (ECF subfamily)
MFAGDEEALVRRSLDGDRRAFGELIGAYQHVLYNVALRMSNDPEDARDITQTTFLKAWRKLSTFDRRNKFFSWIYRIMINETLNLLERRRPRQPLTDDLVSGSESPEEACHSTQVGEIVRSALMLLPEDQRQVIILRHLQQLSYREMSGLLRIPEKTVKSRLYTARQCLAQTLRGRGVTGP